MSRAKTPGARLAARIVGVLVAIGAAAYGGLALASTMAHERITTTRSLPADLTRFDVTDLAGDLIVEGIDDGPNELVQELHTGITSPDVTLRLTGARFAYDTRCAWFDVRCGVRVTARIVDRLPVAASSSSGDIRVTGMRGPLVLDSAGGSITVRDSGGDLQLQSSAGDVTVRDANATTVDASSSGGDVRIELGNIPRRVAANSSAGDVEIILPPGETGYRVEADASDGEADVQVRTDPDSPNVIQASSSAGEVTVRYREP